MRRRDLLAAAAALPFGAGAGSARAAPRRRTRPGDPGWPGPEAWRAFDARLGGALLSPVSMLAPCDAAPKSAGCADRLRQLGNPFFIQDQPGGTQLSGYLDAWTPRTSPWAVVARSAFDVAEAVRFARRHDLRLVIKGGGHSYLGGSNAADSLLIWTHGLREITVHDAFTPEGCAGRAAPTPAVSLGAGCRWIEAYDAVTTRAGRYVQGGGCASVGVAGLVQGGGFGSFSKRYGAAAASLLEAQIVTADGRVRVVNARQDPDLFWALKGGGGGSFGVVTRLTLRTHDLPDRFGSVDLTVKAKSDAAFRRLIEVFLAFAGARLVNGDWGEQVGVLPNNTLKVFMVSAGLDDEAAAAAWAPFLAQIEASAGDWTVVAGPDIGSLAARGWWDVQGRRARKSKAMRFDDRPGAPPIQAWWSGDSEQVGAFIHGYESVWLPAALLEAGERGGLADALFAASRRFAVQLHFNKGLAGAGPQVIAAARDTATNPDMASAFALAIIATGGSSAWYGLVGFPPDLAHARRNAADIAAAAAALRQAAPGAGSYISEASYFTPDWRRSFWGPNYPRLRGVKDRYDPGGLFFVHHGVGAEDWSPDGFARLA